MNDIEKNANISKSVPWRNRLETPIFKKITKKFSGLFLLIVVIPTLASSIYFGIFASDVYISESSFVVRSPRNQNSLSGLGALLQGAGFSRAQDDIYSVHEFMKSRDALEGLTKNVPIANLYSSNQIDFLSRFNSFGSKNNFEHLYQYFQDKISIDLDNTTSISTLKVKAFSSDAAQKINQNLLDSGEVLINDLNDRARQDLVVFAEQGVKEAGDRVKGTADKLNAYRVKFGVFDLQQQTKVQLQLVSKLQDELITIKTQYAQVVAVTPKNPQIPSLKAREKSIRTEINNELAKISGVGDSSFASKASEYERLTLENKLAEQQFTAALASLESSKNEMLKKQLYLELISKPNKPDVALEPQRWRNVFTTLIFGLILFGILKLLVSSVQEHQD